MTTSDVKITPGSGVNVATFDITEDSETKKLQRICINDPTTAAQTAAVDSSGRLSVATSAGTVPTLAKVKAASGAVAAVSIKGSAGTLKSAVLYCARSTPVYIKFYNIAFGSVTVGSSTPAFTLAVPPGDTLSFSFGDGITFGTAISYALTSGIAESDTGTLSTDDLVGAISFL